MYNSYLCKLNNRKLFYDWFAAALRKVGRDYRAKSETGNINRHMANGFIDIICSAPAAAATNPSSHVRHLHIQEGCYRYQLELRRSKMALPILITTLLEITVLEFQFIWNGICSMTKYIRYLCLAFRLVCSRWSLEDFTLRNKCTN